MASNSGKTHNPNLRYCSFCGRNENQVNFLIPSPTGVYICDFCVESCAELIEETEAEVRAEQSTSLTFENLPKPMQIKETLDDHVIGQDEAKIALSVAVYNHYKRILSKSDNKKGRGKSKETLADDGVDIHFVVSDD